MLLVQLIGLSLPFILMMPIVISDFVISAAPISGRIRIAVLLLLANALLTVWIGIKFLSILNDNGRGPGRFLVILGATWLSLQIVDSAHVLSMAEFSRQFGGAGADAEITAASFTLQNTRRFVHYSQLLVIDIWFAVFYGILQAFRMIPRAIAAFGLLAVCVHAAAITMPVLAGYSSIQQLGVSLAISHIAIAVWLLVSGLPNRKKKNDLPG